MAVSRYRGATLYICLSIPGASDRRAERAVDIAVL